MNKTLNIFQKHRLFIVAVLFLFSLIIKTRWSGGYIAGFGYGFPMPAIAFQDFSDLGGKMAQPKFYLIASIFSTVVNLLFWFATVSLIRNILLLTNKQLQKNLVSFLVYTVLYCFLLMATLFRYLGGFAYVILSNI